MGRQWSERTSLPCMPPRLRKNASFVLTLSERQAMEPRSLLRLSLATLITVIPGSYIIWQWREKPEPVLSGLSYESVDQTLSGDGDPAFWTYAIWVLGIFVALTLVTRFVDWLLLTVMPKNPRP